ncbi:hypothetical protein K239x_56090 [Planctomycetes bacterium K23_9]|uniref:Uncharacterized protein n=2 Tax=Stieleria marina TaxID=1930275 RepID=A0A517P2J0_9BACT|nr:hypothetical protein K239x_56090 [Planctomycetes bacterium K23_9]
MAKMMARPAISTGSTSRFSSATGLSAVIKAWKTPVLATFCLFVMGCGKAEVAQTPAATTSGSSGLVSAGVTTTSPTDVVSQFLDQVRRGGANSNAGQFLTKKAQSELQRIGRSVQPIGSPDAHFDVIQAVEVPDEENAMLVESLWTEPNADGTKLKFQVVWSVEKESTDWRISGLAILQEGSEAPEVVDFENGTLMAQLLSDEPAAGTDNQSQAAAPSDGLNR